MDLNLSNIKKYLSAEDRKKVAEKHKKSLSYISKILSKKRKNIGIIEDLVKIAEENKKKMEELESITNSI